MKLIACLIVLSLILVFWSTGLAGPKVSTGLESHIVLEQLQRDHSPIPPWWSWDMWGEKGFPVSPTATTPTVAQTQTGQTRTIAAQVSALAQATEAAMAASTAAVAGVDGRHGAGTEGHCARPTRRVRGGDLRDIYCKRRGATGSRCPGANGRGRRRSKPNDRTRAGASPYHSHRSQVLSQ